MLKKYLFVLAAFSLAACATQNTITGSWVQPIPGMPNQKQGMMLEERGKASSVNMATLLYESWEKKGNTLVLNGKSVGNGQTIPFTEKYTIKNLDNKNLTLVSEHGAVFHYSRP